jgi:hypothetical protein
MGGTQGPEDHHQEGFWMGRLGGKFGLLGNDRKLLKDFAKQVGMSESEYEDAVKTAIAAGKKFRGSAKLRGDFSPKMNKDDYVLLLYSDKHSVSQRVKVSATSASGWYEVLDVNSGLGDGRVPASSAKDESYFNPRQGSIHHLTMDHGELPKDPGFTTVVRDNVAPMIEDRRAFDANLILTTNKELGRKARERHWVLNTRISSQVSGQDKEIEDALKNVALFNKISVAGSADANPAILKSHAYRLIPTRSEACESAGVPTEKLKLGAILLESALILEPGGLTDPSSVDVRALNTLGCLLLAEGRGVEATRYLTLAANGVLFDASAWEDPSLSSGTFQTLAAAYRHVGATAEARQTITFANGKARDANFWGRFADYSPVATTYKQILGDSLPGTRTWEGKAFFVSDMFP